MGLHLVLAGRCDEDLGVPYQPLVEALRHFVEGEVARGAQDLDRRLGRYGGELVRLVPEIEEAAPVLSPPLCSDPETERYRLFDAVAAWLGAVTAVQPALIVLDDLQWAARPTLLLIRHLLRASAPMRLLLIGTYRDSELTSAHPLAVLLADLSPDAAMSRLPLEGLDAPAVAVLVAESVGRALDQEGEALARSVHAETSGNPFFVAEVLRHLSESGDRPGRRPAYGDKAANEFEIPETVRDVIRRRLLRLSGQANSVLQVASVAGPETELAVLRTVLGHDHDQSLVAALDEAVDSRLIRELPGSPPRYRFAHELVRTALYENLSAARRIVLHQQVGEALESAHGPLDDHLPALAHHFAIGSALGDASKAIIAAASAGDRAMTMLAYDDAARYYRQAVRFVPVGEDPTEQARRCGLLIDLGEAQRRDGDPDYRHTLFQAAEIAGALNDGDLLARAALANHRGLWSVVWGFDQDRIRVLEAALAAGDPQDSPVRARLLANLGTELVFADGRDRPLALSDEALMMARRLDDAGTLGAVLLARITTIWYPAGTTDRWGITGELASLIEAGAIREPLAAFMTLLWRSVAAMELADRREAERALRQAEGLAAEFGEPTMGWMTAFLQAAQRLLSGKTEEAEKLAREARSLGVAAGQPDAGLFYGAQLFHVRFEQGRLDEVVERWAEAVQKWNRPLERASLAVAYCELGRSDDARAVFEPLTAALLEIRPDFGWLTTLTMSAAACAHLDESALAPTIFGLLAPYADHIVGTGLAWTGSVSHYLALLTRTMGSLDRAAALFERALASHEKIGAPTWLARSQVEYARTLILRHHRGDQELASRLLHEAMTSIQTLGLTNLARQTLPLLERN